MTIWDLQEMSDEQAKATLSKMTKNDIKQVIDSCGTPQGKSAIKRSWEKLTGNRYIDQMNYTELKEAAREKLNSEGYEAKILVSLPEAPFLPTSDKNMNYGIAYGGILCPLSIEPYIKQATSEKDYGKLISWLASHGGRINFDFSTQVKDIHKNGSRSIKRWPKKPVYIFQMIMRFLYWE